MMKTAFDLNLKSKTFWNGKSATLLNGTEYIIDNSKFYQKLFIILIALSTILIFPESSRELESICENHNSKISCSVW